MMTARPTELIVLPRPSFLPFWTGLATGAFVLCLLFKLYWLSLVPFAITIGLWFVWTLTTGSRTDSAPLDIGHGQSAPPHWQVERPPSWWAMLFAIGGDAVMVTSLIFGSLFLIVVAPQWPPQAFATVSPWLIAAIVAGAIMGALAGRFTLKQLLSDSPIAGLSATGVGHLVTLVTALIAIFNMGTLTTHAQAAMLFALLAMAALHAFIGLLLIVYGFLRHFSGKLSAIRSMDLCIGKLWHDATAVVVLACVVAALVLQFDFSSARLR